MAVGYSEDSQSETVEIYVNDRKLVDILKEYEAPFAGDIAGEYAIRVRASKEVIL